MSVNNLGIPLEKLMCPICRGILIEPVTMPCSHVLCLECFDGTMEMASLTCPLCRKRVGGWLRTAKKQGKLVDRELWKYIQTYFAEYVKNKLSGNDDDIEEELEGTAPPRVTLSMPGEIGKEFESCQALMDKERWTKQQAELRASEEFIRILQEEERLRRERELEDEQVARELQAKLEQEAAESMHTEESESVEPPGPSGINTGTKACPRQTDNKENKPGTSSASAGPSGVVEGGNGSMVRGPLDAFLTKVRPLHGSSCNTPQPDRIKQRDVVDPEQGAAVSAGLRCDSITQEILHFKPINIVPVTPPKTLPDGRIFVAQLIRTAPVKSIFRHETSPDISSPTLVKQLSTLQVERKCSMTTTTNNLPLNTSSSAFKGFRGNSPHRNSVLDYFGPNKVRQQMTCPSSTITSNSLIAKDESQKAEDGMEVENITSLHQPSLLEQTDSGDPPSTQQLDITKTVLAPDLLNSQESSRSNEATAFRNNNEYHGFHDQEHQDFLLAQKLQKEYNNQVNNRVDRSEGSRLAYQLRNRTQSSKGITKRKSTAQRKRSVGNSSSQPTVREAFLRAAKKYSQ